MAWFKVDDKWSRHPKVCAAGPDGRLLWTHAGNWCADQLTDGFVPGHMLNRLAVEAFEDLDGPRHAAAVARLVAVGLWEDCLLYTSPSPRDA